jgi:ABC-2 type transport system permease protein
MEAHKWHDSQFHPAQDATGLQRFGGLSAAWVAQILAPLFIIVLGFNAFSAEREQGTLRQAVSMGLAPRQLLWGKALAVGVVTGLLLVPMASAGFVALVQGSQGNTLADSLTRLAWMVIGYSAYLGIFIFLSLAVSALAPSSRLSLLILLVLWTVNAMIAPRVGSDLSRQWYPTPSKFESRDAMNAEKWSDQDRAFQATFNTTRWEDLPKGSFGRALQLADESGYPAMDRAYAEIRDTFGKQQRVQEWAGLVAPLLAIQPFSMGMAGTDLYHHQEFELAAEQHRRRIERAMSDHLIAHAGDLDFNYRAGRAVWSLVSPLAYRMPPWEWALARTWHSLVVLGIGMLLSMMLAFAAIRRLRVVS